MNDVSNGRINCENLTPDEWRMLEFAELADGWFTPDDAQWLAVRGTLALVTIRRGFEVKEGGLSVQFGVAQIRINDHGKMALQKRRQGEVYRIGKPTEWEDFERLTGQGE